LKRPRIREGRDELSERNVNKGPVGWTSLFGIRVLLYIGGPLGDDGNVGTLNEEIPTPRRICIIETPSLGC